MRITIFEGTIVELKPGRYQYAEITCLTDFTAPRLVLYRYKTTRWPFLIRRVKHSCRVSSQGTVDVSHDAPSIHMEAQIYGLDDLFHMAWVTESDRWTARHANFSLVNWFGKPTCKPNSHPQHDIEKITFGGDNSSLVDASQLATICPDNISVQSARVEDTFVQCERLMLFFESGQTCVIGLNTHFSRNQCLRALHGILHKNKLIHGYPDIDYVWQVNVRYKIQTLQVPFSAVLASGFPQVNGHRFICLNSSEFLIVHYNLQQPEVVCPYSFVRQCVSRKDAQFRIILGRASPLGECEIVLQMSSCAAAQSVHQNFARLMAQSGARYRQLRSTVVSDLSAEFTEQFPTLPRPSTIIHTKPLDVTELQHNELNKQSSHSSGSKRVSILSSRNANSWDTLSRGCSRPRTEENWNTCFPPIRRAKSLSLMQKSEHASIFDRRTRSAYGRFCSSCDQHQSTQLQSTGHSIAPLNEPVNHYVEMTDELKVAEQTPRQMTRSGHDEYDPRQHKPVSISSNGCSSRLTLQNRSRLSWSRHRSPPQATLSANMVGKSVNQVSRPTSHRDDDTLFADVVYNPRNPGNSSTFRLFRKPSGITRQSLSLIHDSGAQRPHEYCSGFSCCISPRLRAMSDITTCGRPIVKPIPNKITCPHLSSPPLPLRSESCVQRVGKNFSASRLSSASYLSSSPVDSSTRNSYCTTNATPASCSNLKYSRELIQIMEIGHEDQDTPIPRPRAHTVGSSLMIGHRLTNQSVASPAIDNSPAMVPSRIVHHENTQSTFINRYNPMLSHTKHYTSVPESSLSHGSNDQQYHQPLPLNFADHYVL